MATKKKTKESENKGKEATTSKKTAPKKTASSKKAASTKKSSSAAKKSTAKKSTASKSTAKKSTAKKQPSTKTTEKKSAAAKKPAKKSTASKSTGKKTAAKKTAKTTTKKATVSAQGKKKAASKKTTKVEQAGKTVPNEPITRRNKVEEAEEPRKDLPRYSDEDLAMFKERILVVRKEALEELSMLRERLDDLTNYDYAEESMIYSMHMAEQGSEAMEKEKTYAQIQRINEYIKKLDDALERIKDKTYGVCRVCGCLIAKQRLMAVPITTLSASYKIQKKCPDDGIDRIEPLKK